MWLIKSDPFLIINSIHFCSMATEYEKNQLSDIAMKGDSTSLSKFIAA